MNLSASTVNLLKSNNQARLNIPIFLKKKIIQENPINERMNIENCTHPSLGSKTTIRGGHSPLPIMLLHKFKVSVSSLDKTWNAGCLKFYYDRAKEQNTDVQETRLADY